MLSGEFAEELIDVFHVDDVIDRAKLKNSDFTKADLSGADLSGADLTNADFDGSKLDRISGLESAIGVNTARHLVLPDAARRP